MPTNDYRNYLMHHGILGQKWGVRRYQNADGSLTPRGQKRYSNQIQKQIKSERKQQLANRRSLSDEELDAKISRLKKEKQFKDLVDEDVQPGRTMVKSILSKAGKVVLAGAAAGALAYTGKVVLSNAGKLNRKSLREFRKNNPGVRKKAGKILRKFDPAEAAKFIFPNPNKKK